MEQMTDAEVMAAVRADTPSGRAVRSLVACMGEAMQATAQRKPPTQVEVWRHALDGATKILAAYSVPTPAPMSQELPADKGKFGGSCNRVACLTPGATWLNRYTDAHYCAPCARAINQANPEGFPIGSGNPAVIEVAPAEAGGMRL